MNKELIHKLANKAEFSVGHIQAEVLCPVDDGEAMFQIMDAWNKLPKQIRVHVQYILEKKLDTFTELVVKECINALPEQTEPIADTVKIIKDHFGIEE